MEPPVRSTTVATEAGRPAPRRHQDALGAAKGLSLGLLASLVLWALAVLLIRAVLA